MTSHTQPTRRHALALGAAALTGGWAAAGAVPSAARDPLFDEGTFGWDQHRERYTLPDLPYAYDALEPHIDAETMEIHHRKHHDGYVVALNVALHALRQIRGYVLAAIETQQYSRSLAFNGSGHFLHCLFWRGMSPDGGGDPDGAIRERMGLDFASMNQFRYHFEEAAAQVEGSGWTILAYEPVSAQLRILQAQNHQHVASWGAVPLLALDMWEHAYYLKHRNDRRAYVKSWFEVVDWSWVNTRYEAITAAMT